MKGYSNYLAEFIGTFAIVFCGTGAIIIDQQTGGAIGHAGVAITFGLIVTAMIHSFGDISGAHFNPAVSFAFWLSGRFKGSQVLPYWSAQLIGGLTASLLLRFLFPMNATLGATHPAGSDVQSFILEWMLTLLLMLVIFRVAEGSAEKGLLAGLTIGMVVLLEAMFAGPICGASMNPVRSLAPGLVSGQLDALWIYLTAPFAGASMAVAVNNVFQD